MTEVNQLVDRFGEAQKMMRQMNKGGGVPGMPAMPGMPGVGGGKRGKAKQPKPTKNKKGRSGNPAKRAQQEAGVTAQASDPSFELPKEFKDLLG